MPEETTPSRRGGHETDPGATRPPPLRPGEDAFPGEFRLERSLGRGAFGEVWLAQDLMLGRPVALKFLRPAGTPGHNEQALELLRKEAQVLASLHHPNVVPIHAWKHGTVAVGPCLVLRYVAGGSLDHLVARGGPLRWDVAARHVADVADGLLLAHRKGVIHRDVKPANVLLDSDTDEALLTDFGIAARLAERGTAAGTPRFMSPEAFRGETSPAQDVYGLAATLFWLITGAAPFDGEDVSTLIEASRRGLLRADPRFAGTPAPLEDLIRAGLAADPARRPSLGDFVQRLRGELNMLLADVMGAVPAPINLRLIVSLVGPDQTVVPLPTSGRRTLATRDLKRVPRSPPLVRLHTGNRILVEVRVEQTGYVTVFNVGPTGNLNLLHPNGPSEAQPVLPAGKGLVVLVAELTPPAGKERLFAVWTRKPPSLRLEELRSLVESEHGAYRATRDLKRMQQSVDALPAADRQTVVLELEHA